MSSRPGPRYLALAAVAAALACTSAGVKDLAPVDAPALIQAPGTILIDVRTTAEYSAGHLQGARHMPLGEFGEAVDTMTEDKATPVVVYCRSGRRSAIASGIMKRKGWTNVHNLQGGILAWSAASLPIVKDK